MDSIKEEAEVRKRPEHIFKTFEALFEPLAVLFGLAVNALNFDTVVTNLLELAVRNRAACLIIGESLFLMFYVQSFLYINLVVCFRGLSSGSSVELRAEQVHPRKVAPH